MAIGLSEAGYDIYAVGRSKAALEELRAARAGITPIAVDVTDREALEAVVTDLHIDVLINNASMMPPLGNFADMRMTEELEQAYFSGRCDFYAQWGPVLAIARVAKGKVEDHVILPNVLAVEPEVMIVRQGGLTSRTGCSPHLVGRVLARVAIEDLCVVADLFDDVVGPLVGQAETLAHSWRDAEELGDLRRRGPGADLVDILGRDAFLLRKEQSDRLEQYQAQPKPKRLPPAPIAWLGINAVIRYQELRAGRER
jgi:hypothetical protein